MDLGGYLCPDISIQHHSVDFNLRYHLVSSEAHRLEGYPPLPRQLLEVIDRSRLLLFPLY